MESSGAWGEQQRVKKRKKGGRERVSQRSRASQRDGRALLSKRGPWKQDRRAASYLWRRPRRQQSCSFPGSTSCRRQSRPGFSAGAPEPAGSTCSPPSFPPSAPPRKNSSSGLGKANDRDRSSRPVLCMSLKIAREKRARRKVSRGNIVALSNRWLAAMASDGGGRRPGSRPVG